MEQEKRVALAAMDALTEKFCKLSDDIWDHPELGYHEDYAAKRQMALLEELGFRDIHAGLAGIPTAFCGSWGHGHPVIAFLGEFDALANMSQQANITTCAPITPNGAGHGCGHHLLGAGTLAAAYGAKEYLRTTGKPGTVVYFGCPAEENGSGKAFMVRDGVFDGVDCALYWHPGTKNYVSNDTTLANFAVRYRFEGVSAHAAEAPHRGRSALDAVELMNTGVQYLREHVPSQVRMHYAITDAGGISPNVVQAHAEVFYLLRAPKLDQVQEVYERVNKIAQGAAMMTETEVDIKLEKACAEKRINLTLAKVMQANLESVPLPKLTEEELAFAAEIRAGTGVKEDPMESLIDRLEPNQAAWMQQQPRLPFCQYAVPLLKTTLSSFSTDVGDVTQVCPSMGMFGATWAEGTAGHSWQAVAQGKSSAAHKGMMFAGKVLAATAIDLLEDGEKLAAAKAEFDASQAAEPFVSRLPKEVPFPMH